MSARSLFLPALVVAQIILLPTSRASENDLQLLLTDWNWHGCNGCTFAQAANVAANLGHGQHYVYDLIGDHIYKFDVECEPVGGGEQCYAQSISPTADAQTDFDAYHNAYLQFHSEAFSINVNYNVPSGGLTHKGLPVDDGYVNAFDTVYTGALDNNLRDYLMNPLAYSGAVATFISIVSNGIGYNIPALTVTVTVYFHDGSKRVYVCDQTLVGFEPVANSARDSQNNPLPDPDKHAGQHNFLFNGPIAHLYNPNNIATLLGTSPPALPQEPLECDWDGIQTLTCQYNP